MDHGVSEGPLAGLENMARAVDEVAEGGANAVLGHKGLVRSGHRRSGRDVGRRLHLSSSSSLSPTPNRKALTASVEDAIRHGADGVSLHINLGDANEADMLTDFGRVARDAERWGMPLLAMVYGRGPNISNSLDPKVVAHCARLGAELGADIIKVPYTGDVASFARVVASCCGVPVLIAGGPKNGSTEDFLRMVSEAMQAGAAGLSVGRNVFQHRDPRRLVAALTCIVHAGLSVEQALQSMGEA
jgi:class I fructose-bisphosphate aldolase